MKRVHFPAHGTLAMYTMYSVYSTIVWYGDANIAPGIRFSTYSETAHLHVFKATYFSTVVSGLRKTSKYLTQKQ